MSQFLCLEVARADIMYDIAVLLNTLKKYNLRDVGRSDEEGEELIKLRETLRDLHRQHGRSQKTNEEETIDLNDSKTQWALSCEAVGSDYWEE